MGAHVEDREDRPLSILNELMEGFRLEDVSRARRVGAQNFLHRDRNTRVRCMHAHARGPGLRWLTFAGVLGTKIIELS
jgi:hypothetical protein